MGKFECIPSSFISFLVLLLLLKSSTSSSGFDKKATLLRRDLLGDWYTLMRNNVIEARNEEDMVDEDEEEDEMAKGMMSRQSLNQGRERGGGREEVEEGLERGSMFQKRANSKLYSFRVPPEDYFATDNRKEMVSGTPMMLQFLPLQKRGPSLSISNNIDVLRNKLREQVNLRMRNRSRNQMILQNNNMLQNLGRRRRR